MRKFSDIIITGSNARMLSNELGTLIGGRYKEIYIHSLSYNEFLKFQQLSDNDEALALYIQYGGLPGLVKIGLEEDDAREYQMDIYHTALLKDVIMRNQIRYAGSGQRKVAIDDEEKGCIICIYQILNVNLR
ncbi:AAA family ATPase [Segatella hominis]|uniref:AAA family ATPase n=1 Tax=Segatella hominis TaxID=2518605 RepID=UPI001F32C29F|nr:AAA family ATPase [Segatella hominis]